jgi:hypothetical protein
MNPLKFFAISLPVAVIPALLAVFMPASAADVYAVVSQSLALMAGAGFAFWLSGSYRKEIKYAFVFLAAFLVVYAFSIPLFTYGRDFLGNSYQTVLLVYQAANYGLLIVFCYFLLRFVDIRRLDAAGWLVFGATLAVSILVAAYPVTDLIGNLFGGRLSSADPRFLPSVQYVIIRLLDAVLITILMPVVWLYIQHLKSERQQSLSFTVVIAGIIFATLADYIFQSLIMLFPRLLAAESPFRNSISQSLYLYGFLMIGT